MGLNGSMGSKCVQKISQNNGITIHAKYISKCGDWEYGYIHSYTHMCVRVYMYSHTNYCLLANPDLFESKCSHLDFNDLSF